MASDRGMIADELMDLAFVARYMAPCLALRMERIASQARTMQQALDEIVASAQDDERDGEAYCAAFNCAKLAGVLVEFPQARRVRRIPITMNEKGYST
jgi:hypothetical protein